MAPLAGLAVQTERSKALLALLLAATAVPLAEPFPLLVLFQPAVVAELAELVAKTEK
jgi:hypothetical protein